MSDASAKSSTTKTTLNKTTKSKKSNLSSKNDFGIYMVNFGVGEKDKKYELAVEIAKSFTEPTIDLAKSVVNYTKYFDEDGKIKKIVDENGKTFVPDKNGRLVEDKTKSKASKISVNSKSTKSEAKSSAVKSDTKSKTNKRIAERTK